MLQPTDPRWLELINTSPDATIFHHPAWMELLSECYGYSPHVLALLDDNGGLRLGLPLMKVNSWLTGHRWVALPYSDYCDPLVHDPAALEELPEQLVRLFQAGGASRVEVRWQVPAHPDIRQYSWCVLHRLKLATDPSTVFSHVKRNHRQSIRIAQEHCVTVEVSKELEHMRLFYELHVETRKRHGVVVQPWRYFELLWRRLVQMDMGFLLLAHKDGQAIAGIVFLYWGRSLIGKYAASRRDWLHLCPNHLLYWEGMRWGCAHGYQVFDMGRTELENTGLRTFKSRWGAVEQPLYSSVLCAGRYNPRNERLDALQSLVIHHSPHWLSKLAGGVLYRHFG